MRFDYLSKNPLFQEAVALLERQTQCKVEDFLRVEEHGETIAIAIRMPQSYEALLKLYYVYNPRFFGCHTRCAFIARGGFRTVFDPAREGHIFNDCRLLALNQQIKNIDIPEGGAKAVLFVRDRQNKEWAQKEFIRALFSISKSEKETLYLGPDENISQDMIDWIAEYSKESGYPAGIAAMTGKSHCGISHKQYGVTSYGCLAAVRTVFECLGRDIEKTPFTIKMTGGPDGDVAGNFIKLLYENYRKVAQVVAIKDASGLLYDEKGLDLSLLNQLAEQNLTVSHYPGKGVTQGDIHPIKADLFFPAGGAIHSLRKDNIDTFCPQDIVSSTVIVEGANCYFSEEASAILEERGAVIIKDFVANKGGVIASSWEVLANFMMPEEEFAAHKEQFVTEIIEDVVGNVDAMVRIIFALHQKTDMGCALLARSLAEAIVEGGERALNDKELDWKQGDEQDFLNDILPVLHSYPIKKLPKWYRRAFYTKRQMRNLVCQIALEKTGCQLVDPEV